jgi:predicted small secreted protein
MLRNFNANDTARTLCSLRKPGGFDMFTRIRARATLALNVLAIIMALWLITGCNTMEGVGDDIAWVGNSLSETAEDVGD